MLDIGKVMRLTEPAAESEQELPRLTSLSPAGGCGCKLDPARLGTLLEALSSGMPSGTAGSSLDDAAVFRHTGSTALLYTIDFFTPLVDDPADWGAIAAAHALSDIYAMGGKPLLALSVAAWTRDDLPLQQLSLALQAAQAKLAEAGAVLAGGHTIWDQSPKLGFTVIGEVDESSVLRKSGGRDGDLLVLTKPLGSGVVCSALKHSEAPEETVRSAVAVMTALNAEAAAAAVELELSCATDVTGFGLAGHLRDLTTASDLAAILSLGAIPAIEGALDLVPNHLTSNAAANRHHANPRFTAAANPEDPRAELLFDPQSSGGLLIACPPDRVDALGARLREAGAERTVIGCLTATESGGQILVEP